MKPKTKKVLKILILILLVFVVFSSVNIAYATGNEVTTEENGITTVFDDGILDGLLGVLFYFVRLIPVLIGGVLQLIAGRVASIGDAEFGFLTMEDILFNKVPILNINFFNTAVSNDSVMGQIIGNIANWYYTLRNLAIILSLVILIYVGIRMAISTIAEDKAKYKKMLTDWIIGFITIFLLHYIIVITVNINDKFIGMLTKITEGEAFKNFAGKLAEQAVNPLVAGFIDGMTGGIVYVLLIVMIFLFLFNYIKRMLTVAFLIVIAPIITVTYSIDKMGDRKISSAKYMDEGIYV